MMAMGWRFAFLASFFHIFASHVSAQNFTALSYPSRPASDQLTPVASSWYGAGNYSFLSSEGFNSSTEAWRAFDNTTSTFWLSSTSYPDGVYTGSRSTAGYSGEWLQMTLPVNIALTSISIRCLISSTTLCPSSIVILGSTDSFSGSWTIVTEANQVSAWNNTTPVSISVNTNAIFNAYRLVFTSGTSTAGRSQIGITEVVLFGLDGTFTLYRYRFYFLGPSISARRNPIREFPPPTGMPSGYLWFKDFSRNYTSYTGLMYPRYTVQVRNTSMAYGYGNYTTWADGIYTYNNGTAIGATEWAPSGAFDKLIYSNTPQQFFQSQWQYTLSTDKTTPRGVYLQMPVPIYLTNYTIDSRYDAVDNPTSWGVYGSTDGANWFLLDSRTGLTTGWTPGRSRSFNVSTTPKLFSYFLINSTNMNSLGELRYFGQMETDSFPILNRYPPTRLLRVLSYVNGMSYGNGIYRIKSSTTDGMSIHKAFDNSIGYSFWGSNGGNSDYSRFYLTARFQRLCAEHRSKWSDSNANRKWNVDQRRVASNYAP